MARAVYGLETAVKSDTNRQVLRFPTRSSDDQLIDHKMNYIN